ncbi:hypothetical protein Arub01_04440 [Actinomadura rubrobrunea]|jgi:hypothetical protein|uniref:Uncharacterized protein n=1 Tax=Actinomadura rubrobrunea TaxID=115335 RepID=A0A9W6PPM0_9ACTN|nr:hypothetical protein [Actinomadura rubrobrunea]GLW62200.1 hypothetical protein Arub01_04440 [Actinomadura rubrobrunea]
MRVKSVMMGAIGSLLASLILAITVGILIEEGAEPGVGSNVIAWTLGTAARAAGGALAAWRTVSAGRARLVIGAAALSGAVGYAVFLLLMVTLSLLAGLGGPSAGDFLGLIAWTAQGALGGLGVAVLLRSRIQAAGGSWSY